VFFFADAVMGFVPAVGQEVTFEIVETTAGPRARNLRRV
jgi:cold shock CspA family protein